MRRRDLLLGVAIVLIWGANFVAIDRGLTRLAPLMFVALRFLFTAAPAVFLVPRPQVGWRNVVALSLLLEGPARDWRSLHQLDATVLWSLVHIVALATLLGFGGWYWLLGRYPASTIAPLGLLVPASGVTPAWALLGQRPTALQLVGAAIAVIGVGLVVAGAARKAPLGRATDAVASTAHP